MKRYTMMGWSEVQPVEAERGDWVKYKDAKLLLKEIRLLRSVLSAVSRVRYAADHVTNSVAVEALNKAQAELVQFDSNMAKGKHD